MRVDQGYACHHPGVIDPPAQDFFSLGQVNAGIDAHGFIRVVQLECVDMQAVCHRYPDHIGQVIFPFGRNRYPAQGRPQPGSVEAVYTYIQLSQDKLFRGSLGFLDDRLDLAVGSAQHPSKTARIV